MPVYIYVCSFFCCGICFSYVICLGEVEIKSSKGLCMIVNARVYWNIINIF